MDKQSFKEFGIYLKEKRQKLGLTQNEVAKKLGYKAQFIANWERGASSPPLMALRKLVDIYEIPQKEILGFINKVETDFWKRNLFGRRQSRAN